MTEKKKKTVVKKTAKKTKANGSKSATKESNREDTRVPIQLLVDYKADGHYLFDFCKDLGAGGVFIQTKSPLPQGSQVDLTFTIPDSKETLITKGQVIWVQEQVHDRKDLTAGMGVQFADFGKEQRSILDNFIRRYNPSNSGPGDKKSA